MQTCPELQELKKIEKEKDKETKGIDAEDKELQLHGACG